MYSWVSDKLAELTSEKYVFWTSFIFFITTWILNPSNKIFILFCCLLFVIYYFKLKSVRLSLLMLYLTSIIIFVGKKYIFELMPPGIFPVDIYPNGYVDSIVFSIKNIVVFAMFLILVLDLLNKRIKPKIQPAEYLLILYFLFCLVTDIFVSKKPDISILFSLFSLESVFESVVAYFYIRLGGFGYKKTIKIVYSLFISLVIFESLISLPQFWKSSPTGNNMESQHGIEYFGETADEIAFRFRPLGTFPHANISGMWFSYMIILIVTMMIAYSNFYYIVASILGIITLVLTLSRGAWLGSGLSFLFILFFVEKVKKIKLKIPKFVIKNILGLSIIFTLILVLFIFPRVYKSFYFFEGGGGNLRKMQFKESMNLITYNPIFGVGTRMAVQEGYLLNPDGVFGKAPLSPHIWYILTMVEHGIPALVLFLLFMLVSLKSVLKLLVETKLNGYIAFSRLGLASALISLIVIGFFQPFIGQTLILITIALLKT